MSGRDSPFDGTGEPGFTAAPGTHRRWVGPREAGGGTRTVRIAPRPTRKPEGDTTMRFMGIVKADKNSEAGVMPSEQLLAEMGKFNEELAEAGVLLAAEGLHPSSKGARVKFSGAQRIVTDGPFAEAKELIAGFWLWQVKSKEEAIEWVKRCPNPMPDTEAEIEIRQVL